MATKPVKSEEKPAGTIPQPHVPTVAKTAKPTDLKMITIAFDVDGTLRNDKVDQTQRPVANEQIRNLLIEFSKFQNVLIHVWSGQGEYYAREVAQHLGLAAYIDSYSAKTDEPAEADGIGPKKAAKMSQPPTVIPDIAIDNNPNTQQPSGLLLILGPHSGNWPLTDVTVPPSFAGSRPIKKV